MNATPDIPANIQAIRAAVHQARDRQARIVALPENAGGMGLEPKQTRDLLAHRQDQHPVLAACQDLAKTCDLWILIGSLAIDISDEDISAQKDSSHPSLAKTPLRSPLVRAPLVKTPLARPPLVNRGFLLDNKGLITAHYDKIHLFNADPPGNDHHKAEHHRESHWYRAGNEAVIADTPWGKWGMTICYDLRFPALYRALAQAGAKMISVPSAFTRPTGQAHWRTLLQARAIENSCFILAPAQCGTHGSSRSTWGHSMIIDPWGEILAEATEEPTVITATIDPARVAEIRRNLNPLNHERPFRVKLSTPA